jgi:hypothetical protein
MFEDSPGKIVHDTLSQKRPITKKGWWGGSRCRPLCLNHSTEKKKEASSIAFFGYSSIIMSL